MTKLDSLIARVEDQQLRLELQEAATDLRRITDFGLVFESHLPETVRLPHHPIRRGIKVAYRDSRDQTLYEVNRVKGANVSIRRVSAADGSALSAAERREQPETTVDLVNLIAVAEFGDPIYPGLRGLGSIQRGGDKPAHVVINGENHHALEALRFTHANRIDCIYIDPPYNSGARDWKYNNDYVDGDDDYRHSKWLAFMERRLKLARDLLNPDHSVLICTIDEKEYLRLGLLLEQVFSGCKVQMVTSVISAKGTMRRREFSRVAEHIFVVLLGEASVVPWGLNMLDGNQPEQAGAEVEWLQLRRREPSSTRASRPNQFFPILVNQADGTLHSIGDSLEENVDRDSVAVPAGALAFWPINTAGKEMVWGLTPETLRERHKDGFFRLRNWKPKRQTVSFQYLPGGTVEAIQSGRISVLGYEPDGSVRAAYGEDVRGAIPKTVWNMESHNAESYGTNLISRTLLPGRRFDYPKSLYAVEDTLRFFVGENPHAVVLDFFGGSGTTAHAVMRLNHQDGGRRTSILVTNNEVSENEARSLRGQGYQPGDPEWEALGIFEHIARPRVTAAATGLTPDDAPLVGDYKFIDEFPMVEGFDENVEFFELVYLDEAQVEVDRAFSGIAPLLWLRAGERGDVIQECLDTAGRRKPYAWTEQYGVLFNTDRWRTFVDKLPATATTVYIVTDSNTDFSFVAGELPGELDVVRLYERYLTTFAINAR